jgi:hypothetical protein
MECKEKEKRDETDWIMLLDGINLAHTVVDLLLSNDLFVYLFASRELKRKRICVYTERSNN